MIYSGLVVTKTQLTYHSDIYLLMCKIDLPVARKDKLLKIIQFTHEMSLAAPDKILPIIFDTPIIIITKLTIQKVQNNYFLLKENLM